MEIIKKKICLENFISRIPGKNKTIEGNDSKNGSWGKIPNAIIFGSDNSKPIKYHTFINLYYSVLDIIMNCDYYEYDKSGKKWMKKNFDWRDCFDIKLEEKKEENTGEKTEETTEEEPEKILGETIIHNQYNPVKFYTSLPKNNLTDGQVVGITTIDNINIFYDQSEKTLGGNFNGFGVIINFNKIIGREIIPYKNTCKNCGKSVLGTHITCECTPEGQKNELIKTQDMFMPYFIYHNDVEDFIKFLDSIKTDKCCEKKKYEEYGGDAFYQYLKALDNKIKASPIEDSTTPTIDIPLLLTRNLRDMGQYRTYNVDEVYEDGTKTEEKVNELKTTIVKTSSESKLMTLKKRKCSVDDNGNELPFILNIKKDDKGKQSYSTELPFQVNYIKNVSFKNNIPYGDTIYSMKEKCTPIEISKKTYDAINDSITSEKKLKGEAVKPIIGINTALTTGKFIRPNNMIFDSRESAIKQMETDYSKKLLSLRMNLISLFNKNYPKILCISQQYSFTDELKWQTIELRKESNEEIYITKTEEVTKTGYIYLMFSKPEIDITYVLGARFKGNTKIGLDERNPFFLGESSYKNWDGTGIWYKETYPMKKNCKDTFTLNDEDVVITYDEIDFNSKMKTYTFQGIDFPRKNYILCEEVMYKSDSYYKDANHDIVFKDEKMLGLNYPLKESYDVVIERGTSAAHEKHIQLTEIKTWQDLENYRNGMFLNK
jgi:hypothetical protein